MQKEQEKCAPWNELAYREEVAGKKFRIYARLLIDPALAQTMETLALRHEERKETLRCGEKCSKAQKGEEA